MSATHIVKILFVIGLFQLAYGQRIRLGACPPVKVQDTLDIRSYIGKWYEYKRTFMFFELFGKCGTANYTLLSENRVKVYNTNLNSV